MSEEGPIVTLYLVNPAPVNAMVTSQSGDHIGHPLSSLGTAAMDDIARRMKSEQIEPTLVAYAPGVASSQAAVLLAAAFGSETEETADLAPQKANESTDTFSARLRDFLTQFVEAHPMGEFVLVVSHDVIAKLHSMWYPECAKLIPLWFDSEQAFALYG